MSEPTREVELKARVDLRFTDSGTEHGFAHDLLVSLAVVTHGWVAGRAKYGGQRILHRVATRAAGVQDRTVYVEENQMLHLRK